MTDYTLLVDLIFNVLNSLFSNVFSSIDSSIYLLLDDITFINIDILENSFFQDFLKSSSKNSILFLANSLLLGILIYYGILFFFSHFTNTYVESPLQFIFKLIIVYILINFSYFICEKIIYVISTISSSIRELGEITFGKSICFSNLLSSLNNSMFLDNESATFEIFSFDSIIKAFSSFGFITLLFSYSLRYIYINILIIFSPFALLSLSLNSTSWIFKTWIKNFISLLLIQVFISIVLLLFFSYLSSDLGKLNQLLYIGLLYSLIQINSFVKELFGGISFNIPNNFFSSKIK